MRQTIDATALLATGLALAGSLAARAARRGRGRMSFTVVNIEYEGTKIWIPATLVVQEGRHGQAEAHQQRAVRSEPARVRDSGLQHRRSGRRAASRRRSSSRPTRTGSSRSTASSILRTSAASSSSCRDAGDPCSTASSPRRARRRCWRGAGAGAHGRHRPARPPSSGEREGRRVGALPGRSRPGARRAHRPDLHGRRQHDAAGRELPGRDLPRRCARRSRCRAPAGSAAATASYIATRPVRPAACRRSSTAAPGSSRGSRAARTARGGSGRLRRALDRDRRRATERPLPQLPDERDDPHRRRGSRRPPRPPARPGSGRCCTATITRAQQETRSRSSRKPRSAIARTAGRRSCSAMMHLYRFAQGTPCARTR